MISARVLMTAWTVFWSAACLHYRRRSTRLEHLVRIQGSTIDKLYRRIDAIGQERTDAVFAVDQMLAERRVYADERPRFAFVIPHIPSTTIQYAGCQCAGCERIRKGAEPS